MANTEREKLLSYVNYEPRVTPKKTLVSCLTMLLLVSVPSSWFGVYSDITKVLILPSVLLGIWILYLLIQRENTRKGYSLFLGTYSFFISTSFLVAAYKIVSTIMEVPVLYVTTILSTYILVNVLNVINVKRLIKKGYYLEQGRTENPLGIIFAMAILGLGIGKALIGNVSQDGVVFILAGCMLFFSFLYTIGTHNLLKFYYLKIGIRY